jgi:hypothetical protein
MKIHGENEQTFTPNCRQKERHPIPSHLICNSVQVEFKCKKSEMQQKVARAFCCHLFILLIA